MSDDTKVQNIGYCKDCKYWLKDDEPVKIWFEGAEVGSCDLPVDADSCSCSVYTDTDGIKKLAARNDVQNGSLKIGAERVKVVLKDSSDWYSACLITAPDHGCRGYEPRKIPTL